MVRGRLPTHRPPAAPARRARAHRVLLVRQAEPLEGRELELLLLLLGVHDGGERDADREHGGGGGAAAQQGRRREGPGSPRAAAPAFKSPPRRGAHSGRGQTPPSHWMHRPDVRDPRAARDRRPPAARDLPGLPRDPPGTSGPADRARGPCGRPPPRDRAAAPARLGGRGARGTRLSGNRSGLNKATRLEAAPERERIPPPLNRFRGSGQVVLQMRLVQMPGNAPGCERSAGLRPFRYVYLGGGLRVLEFRQICGRVGNNRAA